MNGQDKHRKVNYEQSLYDPHHFKYCLQKKVDFTTHYHRAYCSLYTLISG